LPRLLLVSQASVDWRASLGFVVIDFSFCHPDSYLSSYAGSAIHIANVNDYQSWSQFQDILGSQIPSKSQRIVAILAITFSAALIKQVELSEMNPISTLAFVVLVDQFGNDTATYVVDVAQLKLHHLVEVAVWQVQHRLHFIPLKYHGKLPDIGIGLI